MPYKLFQIDAFTKKPFAGNPAAVCVMEKAADEAWMQSVAAEMNLSETAFLWPHEDPFKRMYRLRWFTPVKEVDLCGHATLASAHVLFTEGYMRPTETARFLTASGELTAVRGMTGRITLNFPARGVEEIEEPAGLRDGLGCDDLRYIGLSHNALLVELADANTIINLNPNLDILATLEARAVMVTANGDGTEYDFVSRMFAPKGGIPEDPVTGSAHCTFGPYWQAKLGKTSMQAFQASPRGGELGVDIDGERILLHGDAVTVLRGELDA